MEHKSPKKPSYTAADGASSPGIFLTKGVNISQPITEQETDNGSSDRRPVSATMSPTISEEPVPKCDLIPRRQRANLKVLEQAMKLHSAELGKCLTNFREAKDTTELETAYSKFKKIIFLRWEKSGTAKPSRCKSFWNGTLDRTVR